MVLLVVVVVVRGGHRRGKGSRKKRRKGGAKFCRKLSLFEGKGREDVGEVGGQLKSDLEEIVGCTSGDVWFSSPRCRIKLKERVLERVVQFHDGRLISTPITVVRRGENCYDITIMTPIVSFHYKLMSTSNKRKAVAVVE